MITRRKARTALVTGCCLAAVGALAGLWLTDHHDAWLGVMIAAVTSAFAPSLFTKLKDRRQARKDLERALEPERQNVHEQGPAGLLDPRRALVTFIGRQAELSDLIAWCEDDESGPIRLLTGPGGTGKSRLAVELASQLTTIGWHCERIADDAESTAVERVRQAVNRRILLVVDYAETRTGLTRFLHDIARHEGHALRALLIARSAGEWWERLGATDPAIRHMLGRAYAGNPLTTVVEAAISDAEIVRMAVPVFAAALAVRAPRHVEVTTQQKRARILDLHAAALVAALQSGSTGTSTVHVSVNGILIELLAHEDRFWQGSAQRFELLQGPTGLTVATLRRIVAAACLLGASTEDEVTQLLKRVPGSIASTKVASWLRDLYPPLTDATPTTGHPQWLGTLQPDRLAEYHVVNQLKLSPELAENCLSNIDDRQALRALTVLGRAASESPAAKPFLRQTLPLLSRVVSEIEPNIDTLNAIANTIMWPPCELSDANVIITQRLLDLLPSDDSLQRAKTLSQHGMALNYAGEFLKAVDAVQEALAIFRSINNSYPGQLTGGIQGCLTYLTIIYENMGRISDAIITEKERLSIEQELTHSTPSAKEMEQLAKSFDGMCIRLDTPERCAEIVEPAKEAASVYRNLAELTEFNSEHRTRLASALHYQSRGVAAQYTERLLPLEQAAALRKEIAGAYPGSHHRLSSALSNVYLALVEPDHLVAKLAFSEEEVVILRELAAIDSTYSPTLAYELLKVSQLIPFSRDQDALSYSKEAVEVWRKLAEADSGHLAGLAFSLSSLGRKYAGFKQYDNAVAPSKEAAEIYRKLVTADPSKQAPLGSSLQNLVFTLGKLNQPNTAIPYAKEAVEIRRELTEKSSDQLADLAYSLKSLAWRLYEQGCYDIALDAARESEALYRQLVDKAEIMLPGLANALELIGNLMTKTDQPQEGLEFLLESATIERKALRKSPYGSSAALVETLTEISDLLETLHRPAEALQARKEAALLLKRTTLRQSREPNQLG
ncbi:tetratricopeptide repeat protein [Amycolatopsis sp. NPDC049691]|uniref:tetratricopeptide repeat protein n=1 Tax=Amycolatopsis sp. NPDC049691 TaxID=3155155 RepID=UPI00343A5096